MKILIATTLANFRTQFWGPAVEEKLKEYGFEAELFFREKLSLDDLPCDSDVEAVVTSWGSPRIAAQAFEKFPRLKFLGHCAGSVAAVASPEFYERGGRIFSADKQNKCQYRPFLVLTLCT